MWYLISLIWLALVAGVVWNYRRMRRKQLDGHAQKFEALLSEIKLDPHLKGGAALGETVKTGQQSGLVHHERTVVTVPAAPVPLAPVTEFAKKQRLLPQTDALLYFVFRSGLPDHEIFANLSLADVIEIAPAIMGYDREQRLRGLDRQRLDLVICNRQLEVIAVVLIDKGALPQRVHAANVRHAADCLQAAGIRLVHVDAAAPPRHHQVRGLVYGVAG